MTKIFLTLKLTSVIIILVILSIVHSQNKDNSQTSKYEYKIFNLEGYIYDNLKLNKEDYKLVSVKQNYQGEVMYFLQLYKAQGTLLVYYDLNTDTAGYRIIPEIKIFNTVSFNHKREILINSLAMGNKFYYISPKVNILSFESPSYNLSEPIPAKDYFYWVGYKYDKDKKTDRKLRLFRYRYNKIENFNISEIKNNFDREGYKILDLKLINNNLYLNVLDKNKNHQVFQYNLISNEMKNIHSSKMVIFDPNPIQENLLFLEIDGKYVNIYQFKAVEEDKEKVLSLKLDENIKPNERIYNFYTLIPRKNQFFVLLNLKENENFINKVFKGGEKIFENNFESPANIYLNRNNPGIFYVHEYAIVEVIK